MMQFRISDLVIYQDHHMIALSKPHGIPTQEDSTGDASLHRMAQAYSKRDLHPVNRLDRPCSGIVIFAKTQKAAASLHEQWQERTVTKTYLAIIHQGLPEDEGALMHDLKKTGNKCIATAVGAPEQGTADSENSLKRSTLNYKTLRHLDHYDYVEITTDTGYFHQVRAQLASAGCPVRGDVKYGARRKNPDRSINLHCARITLMHPSRGEKIVLSSTPSDWPE